MVPSVVMNNTNNNTWTSLSHSHHGSVPSLSLCGVKNERVWGSTLSAAADNWWFWPDCLGPAQRRCFLLLESELHPSPCPSIKKIKESRCFNNYFHSCSFISTENIRSSSGSRLAGRSWRPSGWSIRLGCRRLQDPIPPPIKVHAGPGSD